MSTIEDKQSDLLEFRDLQSIWSDLEYDETSESLSFSSKDSIDFTMNTISALPNLTSLKVNFDSSVYNGEIVKAKNYNTLKHLVLKRKAPTKPTMYAVSLDCLKKFTNLESLEIDFDMTLVYDFDISCFEKLKRLEFKVFSFDAYYSNLFWDSILSLKHLKYISLQFSADPIKAHSVFDKLCELPDVEFVRVKPSGVHNGKCFIFTD